MTQKNKQFRNNYKENNVKRVYRLACKYWNSGINLCILERWAAKSSQLDKKKKKRRKFQKLENGISLFGKYSYYCKHENNNRIEKYKIQNKATENHNN